MALLRNARSPIGLDVGRRKIKAVQLNRGSAGWRVSAAASLPRAPGQPAVVPSEVRRLREELAARGFKGHSVVLAVPPESVLSGIMELPPADSGAPMEILARAELGRIHKCDPQSLEMSCWTLPAPARAANTTFVMGVACTHADANGLLDTFEAEGFDVERLDVQIAALARTCRPLLKDAPGTAGVLDLGWTAARLVLMYRGTVVYERKLARSGLQGFVRALADRGRLTEEQVEQRLAAEGASLDLPDRSGRPMGTDLAGQFLDGLVDEMRVPLSYSANQYPDAALARLLLVGGGAKLPGLADHLAAALACPVRGVLPSDLAAGAESLGPEHGSELTMALGLGQMDEV
ncbi:MAG TPA: pilus assembly protein PilM [Phycisphaerae bacterium]|nr:pilus assembly protein PilM [Phycisphaerae bacterium]